MLGIQAISKRTRKLKRSDLFGFRQKHHEFFATEPGDDIAFPPDDISKAIADDPQALVSCQVTVGVIIKLEAIDIDHHHTERCPVSDAPRQLNWHCFVESAPIESPCQAINLARCRTAA
jgi:hypothetical protein